MIIHVVRRGESIYSISRLYGVPAAGIISNNELANPNQLAVGQTLVILEGTRRHTVAPGESLYSIAARYGLSLARLREANPQITGSVIYPGQVLIIPERTQILGTIEVNGYAYPTIDMNVLRRTLPSLTYLSIFSYDVNANGTLVPINDTPLITAARQVGVAPVMVITNRDFSSDVASSILNNPQVQNTLIDNVLRTLRTKNYYGLNIDFEYLYPRDRENYNNFLRRVNQRIRSIGYPVFTSVAPKVSADQPGLLYEAHDYPVHGALVDRVIIMTYEWGYTYGPPLPVAPLNEVRRVLNYAVTAIPRQKILMGIPNYGYDWTLPYVQGTAAATLSNTGAVNLALREGAAIQYDTRGQSPYFYYYDDNGRRHVVWFEDARSIEAKLRLVNEYGLRGVSFWTIGRYSPQNWLVLRSLYYIRRVL